MEFARGRIWSVFFGVVFAAVLIPVHLLHAGLHDHGHHHGPDGGARLEVIADCLLCDVLLPVTGMFTMVAFIAPVVIMAIYAAPSIRTAPLRTIRVVADRGPPHQGYKVVR
jgi:hypothetical protein